jgi:hypothetical protein
MPQTIHKRLGLVVPNRLHWPIFFSPKNCFRISICRGEFIFRKPSAALPDTCDRWRVKKQIPLGGNIFTFWQILSVQESACLFRCPYIFSELSDLWTRHYVCAKKQDSNFAERNKI